MQKFEKVMVGLDLSSHDEALIQCAKYINLFLRPEKICFVHIQNNTIIPQDIVEQYPDLMEAIDSFYIKKLVEEIQEFNIVGTEIDYVVSQGNPFTELLKKSHERAADLLVIGKKNDYDYNITPAKLARKVNTNLLVVPPVFPEKIKTILVATDFSDYSGLALGYAIALAETCEAKVVCQHVFNVPMGYSKIGKTYEEFADIMRENSKKAYDTFIKKQPEHNCDIEPLFTLNDQKRVSQKILQSAREMNADMVIMGAKGRTGGAALFLGSVTEELIRQSQGEMIMVVRKKDKTFGLWDAIKNL